MIKKIIVSFGLLFSLGAVAQQEGTASPYSYYGIGDVRFKGTAETRSMGGLGIIPDSIHINLQNPASYAALKLTTFSVGGSFNVTNLKTSAVKDRAQRTTLDYLAVAFPAGKLGFGFGLIPYSSVGYKVRSGSNTSASPYRAYSGEGGMNKVYAGAGYQISSKFRVGVDFNYNFGNVETKNIWAQNLQYATRELNTSDLSGFNVNTGVMFNTKINKKYDFYASATYTPESTLKSDNTRQLATIIDYGGAEAVVESRDLGAADTDIKMPSKLSFGAGFGKTTQWFVGGEVTLQQSSKFGNRNNDIQNVTYEDAKKYSIGGYFIPEFNSFTSYWKRITYRAGLKYENLGLVISDVPIKDYGFTLGLGLPVGGAISNLNVGFEYGKRGTTEANLVKENYANVFLSLSLNDKWFVKRKYD